MHFPFDNYFKNFLNIPKQYQDYQLVIRKVKTPKGQGVTNYQLNSDLVFLIFGRKLTEHICMLKTTKKQHVLNTCNRHTNLKIDDPLSKTQKQLANYK